MMKKRNNFSPFLTHSIHLSISLFLIILFFTVKNGPGSPSDNPDTAREYISNLAKRWVAKAGASLESNSEGAVCEVAPLTSYGGEGLDNLKGKEIKCPFSL